MKRITLAFLCSLMALVSNAQSPSEPDKSPLDISYSPNNYPVLRFQSKQTNSKQLNARIIYSRPQVKERTIFGGELKYGDLWRLGANESTELDLFKNAVIGGKKVPKGRYTMYCIPEEKNWTIIINKDTDSWGGFSYNQSLDVVRITVPVTANDTPVEYLTMYFDNPNNLLIMWDNVKVNIPISFSAK